MEIALLEKNKSIGLEENEIKMLLDLLQNDEIIPMEISHPKGKSSAIGFLTKRAADRLKKYDDKSPVGKFIATVLKNDKRPDDAVFVYEDLQICIKK